MYIFACVVACGFFENENFNFPIVYFIFIIISSYRHNQCKYRKFVLRVYGNSNIFFLILFYRNNTMVSIIPFG